MVYVYTVLYVAICSIASTQAGYDYNYLTDDCNADPDQWVIDLGRNGASTYGVVQLMRSGEYGTGYNCSLKLVPPAGYSLNIVVDRIDIYALTPYDCIYDYLEISTDSDEERYCGREANDKVLDMDNYAVVRFVSGAIPHPDDDYYGFSLYYNVFHTSSGCSTNEHACVNNRCILSELTCDNKNNCGDYTDEQHCPLPGWVIFLIVLGSLVALVIIVVIVAICCCVGCCCCKKSKRTTVHNVYPQIYAVNTTTNSEPIAMASH